MEGSANATQLVYRHHHVNAATSDVKDVSQTVHRRLQSGGRGHFGQGNQI